MADPFDTLIGVIQQDKSRIQQDSHFNQRMGAEFGQNMLQNDFRNRVQTSIEETQDFNREMAIKSFDADQEIRKLAEERTREEFPLRIKSLQLGITNAATNGKIADITLTDAQQDQEAYAQEIEPLNQYAKTLQEDPLAVPPMFSSKKARVQAIDASNAARNGQKAYEIKKSTEEKVRAEAEVAKNLTDAETSIMRLTGLPVPQEMKGNPAAILGYANKVSSEAGYKTMVAQLEAAAAAKGKYLSPADKAKIESQKDVAAIQSLTRQLVINQQKRKNVGPDKPLYKQLAAEDAVINQKINTLIFGADGPDFSTPQATTVPTDIPEGKTATGPSGQKLIRRGGKWEPL